MEPTQCVLLVGLQVLVVFVSFAPVFIAGQDGKEYLTLSIDCGSNRNYTDDVTGIPWVTDEAFIQTGTNARNVTVYPSDYAYVNKGQLSTLRYFDDSRTRHCYVLPVKARTTYLLRSVFFLGNLTDSINGNITFWIYFNATMWWPLSFDPDWDHNVTSHYEAIIYSPGAELSICLVKSPNEAAFISTLELRELTSGMYSSAAAGGYQYQDFFERVNPGVTPASDNVLSYLRFPDDPYDRIWWSPGSWDGVPRIKNTRTSSSSVQLQNRPPNVVMNDAWTRDDTDTLYFSTEYTSVVGPIVTYCYVMEFEENGSAPNMTGIQYAVNGILIDTFNASSVPQEIISSITVAETYYNMTFTPIGSTSPAVLNAFEVYKLYDVDNFYTAIADVKIIANIKKAFNLIDWSGDPCLPLSYDWLICTSSEETSASREYSASEYRITGLSLVNVTNDATGKNDLAKITGLTNLTNLYLSGNSLRGRPLSLSLFTNLTVLDMSDNNFDGEVVDFVRFAGISTVRELNLSDNQFSSFSSQQSSPLFTSLTKLDLSKNHIGGDVMNFVTSIRQNSITELYAANNVLEGQFTTSQLSAQFHNIEMADFDNQKISGTLDMSNWTLDNMMTQLIKLRNNSIEKVYPALDVLSWKLRDNVYPRFGSVRDYRGGILLSGNPWCGTTNSKTLAQRYLCREDLNESVNYQIPGVPRPESGETNWKEIIGIGVGASIFIICCMIGFAIMLRKLRKKSRALTEIQAALTKQKVHPPLYSYAELRTATKNFAYDNNLGQGAYGAVYMGKLVDGTQVAVKKLFKDSQVLAEFLNEAVLITGIKHRNLAQLKGCCIDQEQRILVYEYAENGNLAEALWGEPGSEKTRKHQTKGPMSWNMRLNICIGIARGLSYLHEELQPRIIHRDIKPANILIDVNFNVKIADFGLARSFLEEQTRAEYTQLAGTFGYLAPEYIMQGQLTEKADVYSCGVVLLEIVSGRKCIDQNLPPERVSLIRWADTLRKKGHVMDILDSSIKSNFDEVEILRVIDIAFSCLDVEPFKRPTMSQVVTILQGNASSFKRPLPSFSPFSGSPGTKFSRFGAARSVSLGSRVARNLSSESASYTHDSSDQLAFLLDQTSRSQDLEMSSISGR